MVFTRPTWTEAANWMMGEMVVVVEALLVIAIVWQGIEYMFHRRLDHDRWLAILFGGGLAMAGQAAVGWMLS